jgi:anti-sigma B factor antagonist
MDIAISHRDDTAIATLSGEIDGKTAPEVQATLAPVIAGSSKIVLDMSAVTFLSSAGLRVLLLVYRQAAANHGKVALAGLSEQIRDVMSVTGFLRFFHLADSLEDAVKGVQ